MKQALILFWGGIAMVLANLVMPMNTPVPVIVCAGGLAILLPIGCLLRLRSCPPSQQARSLAITCWGLFFIYAVLMILPML
jgi:hypothetical protein